MAETDVGSRMVFGASVCRLAGTHMSQIRWTSSVAWRLTGLRSISKLGGGVCCKTEQCLPLLGLYGGHKLSGDDVTLYFIRWQIAEFLLAAYIFQTKSKILSFTLPVGLITKWQNTHTSSLSSSVSILQKEFTDRSSLRSSWLFWGGSTRPLKNSTVSGLGLGHDRMPCLSTQHSTYKHKTFTTCTHKLRLQWQQKLLMLNKSTKWPLSCSVNTFLINHCEHLMWNGSSMKCIASFVSDFIRLWSRRQKRDYSLLKVMLNYMLHHFICCVTNPV